MNPVSCNVYWLGIDLAKQTFDAAIANSSTAFSDWRAPPVKQFGNHAQGRRSLLAWLKRQLPPDAVLEGICVESTGRLSRRFADALGALDPALPLVSIINPKRSVDFGRSLGIRDKTDRIDAAILALYAVNYCPAQTPAPAPFHQRLRELSRAREAFVGELQTTQNRLGDSEDALVARLLKRQIAGLKNDIKQLEQEARQVIADTPGLRQDYALLLSIKGIGPITAWVLLAELGDLRGYSRAQIVAFVGLYPRSWSSGTTVCGKPRLVKGGGAAVRRVLFNGARSILTSKDNTLREYADDQQLNGKKPIHCLVAVMRKLLLIARAVILSGVKYDPEFVPNS